MKKVLLVFTLILLLTLVACSGSPRLPELSGQTEVEVTQTLSDLDIQFNIMYIESNTIETGYFISYDIVNVGDRVDSETVVIVYIADNGYLLPDLTGETEADVIATLDELGITYEILYEHNYSLSDYAFSRYEMYNANENVPKDETLQVYITWNGSFLPDLSSMYRSQIEAAMAYDFIQNYTFEYIINDNMPEDLFSNYDGYEAGSPAVEEGMITIYLYKNTFTNSMSALFISKYLDGENNDRAIELYNPTDQSIDLSYYHLSIFTNGSYEETFRIELSGMLTAQETYLIVYGGSKQELLDKADNVSNRLFYDGNDVIQLRYSNETYIDTIYALGETLFIMEDELFIRNEDTVVGSRTFNLNQWDAYVPDYYESFDDGMFPLAKPESFTIDSEYLQNTFGSLLVSGMIEVTPSTINDGDTIAFTPGFTQDKRVRFLGVDTPETYPIIDPWGLEAKAFTTSVVEAGTVFYLQSDPELGTNDTYGRTLAYVWVDGVMLNYELVKNGYSFNYLSSESRIIFEHRYLFRWFQDAEKYASEHELGIHS